MESHLDPPIGAKAGVRLPCDVREQARREAQPPEFGLVVEQWSDPLIEEVAMLSEPMLAAAGAARLLGQRIHLLHAWLEPRVEEALADPVRRDDELRRLQFLDQ